MTILNGGSFQAFNDPDGNPLIALKRDGTISTQGVRFPDGTEQTSASSSNALPSALVSTSATPPSPVVAGHLPAGDNACLWIMKTDGNYYPFATVDNFYDVNNGPPVGGTLLFTDRLWYSDAALVNGSPGKAAKVSFFHSAMTDMPTNLADEQDDRLMCVLHFSYPANDYLSRPGATFGIYGEVGIVSTPTLRNGQAIDTVAAGMRWNTHLSAPVITCTAVSVQGTVATITAVNTLCPTIANIAAVYFTSFSNPANTWLNGFKTQGLTVLSAGPTSFTVDCTGYGGGNYTTTADTGKGWFAAPSPFYGIDSTLELESGMLGGNSGCCGAAFRGNVESSYSANLAVQPGFLASFKADFSNSMGSRIGGYAGFYAQVPPNRAAINWGITVDNFGSNLSDWGLSIGGGKDAGASYFGGPVVLGPHSVLRTARATGSAPGDTDAAGLLGYSSATTASYVFSETYTVAPMVFIQPNVPGSITFTLTTISTTGFTVTASAPFTGTVSYFTIGAN